MTWAAATRKNQWTGRHRTEVRCENLQRLGLVTWIFERASGSGGDRGQAPWMEFLDGVRLFNNRQR